MRFQINNGESLIGSWLFYVKLRNFMQKNHEIKKAIFKRFFDDF